MNQIPDVSTVEKYLELAKKFGVRELGVGAFFVRFQLPAGAAGAQREGLNSGHVNPGLPLNDFPGIPMPTNEELLFASVGGEIRPEVAPWEAPEKPAPKPPEDPRKQEPDPKALSGAIEP